MPGTPRNRFFVGPEYQPIVRAIGLDADTVFTHPDVKVWRSIADRENCTLDYTLPDGRVGRWHVKRYVPARGFTTSADAEVNGVRALQAAGIATVPLVGWGMRA